MLVDHRLILRARPIDSSAWQTAAPSTSGKILDPSTGKPGPDDLVIGSSDLTTHGVVVGMTGSGKTGLAIILLEEALLAGHSRADHRSQGRHGEPRAHLPGSLAGELPALGERVRRPGGRHHGRGSSPRRPRRPGARGSPPRASGPSGSSSYKDAADVTIYTPGSAAGVPLNVIGSLARAHALLGHRGRDAPRRDRRHGHEPPRARRDRRRSALEPRARPALEPDRERMAGRPRPRPRRR